MTDVLTNHHWWLFIDGGRQRPSTDNLIEVVASDNTEMPIGSVPDANGLSVLEPVSRDGEKPWV